jgi:hypothetical protein
VDKLPIKGSASRGNEACEGQEEHPPLLRAAKFHAGETRIVGGKSKQGDLDPLVDLALERKYAVPSAAIISFPFALPSFSSPQTGDGGEPPMADSLEGQLVNTRQQSSRQTSWSQKPAVMIRRSASIQKFSRTDRQSPSERKRPSHAC